MDVGYIPDRNASLIEEINFGIKYFDFLELSFSKDLEKYCGLIKDFTIIGHSGGNETILEAEKSLEFFSKINVEFYVVHLSASLSIEETKLLIEKLGEEYGITLLPENSKRGFYSNCFSMEKFEITLDIGHAIVSNQLECFLNHKNIKHVHLNDVFKDRDHVKILNTELLKIAKNLKVPVLLEIFYDVEKGLRAFNPEERRKYLVELKEKLE